MNPRIYIHINIFFISLAALLIPIQILAVEAYEVYFEGVEKTDTLALLKSASRLVNLQSSPPATYAGLKRRAESDIANFVQVLHSLAYYNAKVDITIDNEKNPALVVVHLNIGPVYPLVDYRIISEDHNCDAESFDYDSIKLKNLGIVLDKPATPKSILDAEDSLLQIMSQEGYPLAEIKKREVVADQSTKTVSVFLFVESGPQAMFGQTTISGNEKVKDLFFCKKIAWEEGEPYDQCLVEKTRNALEASGLFSSITITHAEKTEEDDSLPMEIHVIEGKFRSIGAGVSYATDLGPGVIAEWENRNIRGLGEKLSFKTNVSTVYQEGTLLYLKPDFCRPGQDLLWLAELKHEETKGYRDNTISFSGIIDRQLNENARFSYGGMYKKIWSTHSDNNRVYNLAKVPMQYRWSNSNNLLDPTKGRTLNIKIIPSLQVIHPSFAYCINVISGSIYRPITKDRSFVIAAKATLGSIVGASEHSIPPSEKFYAGSDNLLRGYHYLTVSPLKEENGHLKPIGGRSMMIYSLEARWRACEKIGLVLFYDFGNVYRSTFPEINHKILQSAGIGFRYYTPVGPLRLDLAIPLNRRHHFDGPFQLYFSIGQAF